MNNLSRDDFYKKYENVAFKLVSFSSYTFYFEGDYENKTVYIEVGGNPQAIYNYAFSVQMKENIYNLEPYSGICEQDNFYDY